MKKVSEYIQIITRQLFRATVLVLLVHQTGYLSPGLVWACFVLAFFSEIDNI